MDPQSEAMPTQRESDLHVPVYPRLFHNRAFVLFWSGQTVSSIGDPFFNLTVMWVVYTQSRSALQTALIQVVWHLSRVLCAPIAGILADRWDRKRIMVLTNLFAAGVVAAVAAVIPLQGHLSPLVAFSAVFLLNSVTTFLGPAQFSIMPEIVGRDLLATASGTLATARQVASLLGNALAGVVVAIVGTAGALVIDAVSFLLAASTIAIAQLPHRTSPAISAKQKLSLLHEIRVGWRTIADLPVVRMLVWLSILINIASFTGPLVPALISQQLGGGAPAYGLVEAMGIIGGIAGGALVGILERRRGAGELLIIGWGLGGACLLGMAASTALVLTALLEAILAFGLTIGGIASAVLTQAVCPGEYRGRVAGISAGLSVIAIPPSTLIGGWLADILGPAPLFACGGVWILSVAALAWSSQYIRTAGI